MKRAMRGSAKVDNPATIQVKQRGSTVANVNKPPSKLPLRSAGPGQGQKSKIKGATRLENRKKIQHENFNAQRHLSPKGTTQNFPKMGKCKKVDTTMMRSTRSKQVQGVSQTRKSQDTPTTAECSLILPEEHINMTVQAEEDQFGHSEDEANDNLDDPEVTFRSSQESNYSAQEDDEVDDQSETDSVKILPMTEEQRRQQIDEIDQEVFGKLQQFHTVMMQGGLASSAKLLETHFGVLGDEPKIPGATLTDKHLLVSSSSREPGRAALEMEPNVPAGAGMPRRVRISDNRVQNYNNSHKASVIYPSEASRSVETIYKNAVLKRISSSSEEDMIDVGDHSVELFSDPEFQPDYEDEPMANKTDDTEPHSPEVEMEVEEPTAGPSRDVEQELHHQRVMTPSHKARKIVLEAEKGKAARIPKTGIAYTFNPLHVTAKIDEDYQVIGAHIYETTKVKIIHGEYVDFGKLLPKDRILSEEDNRLELVVKNGKTFWMPVSETVSINGFSKWEQAFRIYSNIYMNQYPHWSTELIQYNHVIHSILGLYTWDNVYSYDREFRLHLAKHPERSWSVILQQAWSMKLRDRLNTHFGGAANVSYDDNKKFKSPSGQNSSTGEPCRRYNKGKCNFGAHCRYDHRCAYAPCRKFGHSILNCRKLAADKERTKVRDKSSTGPSPN